MSLRLRFCTRSAVETKRVARVLGKRLQPGDVVALHGGLGAGKTTFVKGLARALGVRSEKDVSSPTFVLIHEYRGRAPVYHLDWYRLERVSGADREMALECLRSDAVTLIEWPERGRSLIPRERIDVRLSHRGGCTRRIEISAHGKSAGHRLSGWGGRS